MSASIITLGVGGNAPFTSFITSGLSLPDLGDLPVGIVSVAMMLRLPGAALVVKRPGVEIGIKLPSVNFEVQEWQH